MVLLKVSIFFIIVFNFFSCAKLGYIVEQGQGQISLLMNSRDNQKILEDPNIKNDIKEKIKLIEKYKLFFFNYFDQKPNDIYSETTFLKNKAVTYLVIRSPYDKIKASKECFPFVGCFPYLGFFSKKSAVKYKNEWAKKGYYTYMRDVYAYSTLGNFEDRILSSFFYYDNYQLAELIFHELFHTIFFVKNDVKLNENLANFIGKELVKLYFKTSTKLVQKHFDNQKVSRTISIKINQLISEYKVILSKNQPNSKGQSDLLLNKFIASRFNNEMLKTCHHLKLKKCYPIKKKWDNAKFAAMGTYEAEQKYINKLFNKSDKNVAKLYNFLKSNLKTYNNTEKNISFSSYLNNLSI